LKIIIEINAKMNKLDKGFLITMINSGVRNGLVNENRFADFKVIEVEKCNCGKTRKVKFTRNFKVGEII